MDVGKLKEGPSINFTILKDFYSTTQASCLEKLLYLKKHLEEVSFDMALIYS